MTDIPSMDELKLLHGSICQALGDPKRIQMLYALHQAPHYVTELAEALNMPQPSVSRHLGVLRQRGLVQAERSGASVVYHLAEPKLIEVLDAMRLIVRDVLARQTSQLH